MTLTTILLTDRPIVSQTLFLFFVKNKIFSKLSSANSSSCSMKIAFQEMENKEFQVAELLHGQEKFLFYSFKNFEISFG